MDNNQSNSVWAQSIPVKEQLSVIKRLAKMAGFVKWKFIFSGLLVLLFSLVQALLPWMLGEFIDTGLTKENTTLQTVLYFAMIFTGIRVITSFVSYFQNQIYQDAAESALNEVRRRLYQKLHSLGMRYFDQTPGGSLVTRVMNDTESFFDFWFLFSTLITTVTSVIFAYIFMYQADAKLALWLLIFLPIILASIWLYQRVSSGVYRRMRERLSSLNAKLAESINGISTIKSFHQESRITDEYLDINQQYYNARVSMIKNDARLLGPLNQLLQGIAVVVIYLYLGQTSIRGLIAAGSAYVFISLATNIFSPLSNLQQQMSSFQDGVVSGYRAGKILDETEYEPSQNPGADKTITDGRIEFKNVNFSYDDKNVILKNLSFVAEPGQTVALVGHTGSGKSSTINALMRFYEFQSGQILIDGQDIRDLDMADFRRKTGLVLQDAFMFFGDIKSNIRMYDETITDEQIKEAAEFVSADEFINALPEKYDTPVLEGGTSLSGGQKQLLSFARTIVRNPKILILDEATANIDTQTETIIQTALKKMRSNRTTIAIAHRLSTIKDADLILVLDKGEVVERGTHDQLIAKKGYYYDLYKMQSNS